MYKKVIYVVNEVKGETEGLRTSVDYNVVRDYAGNGKSFIKVSLTQDDVPTTIITQNHRFESKQIEVTGGKYRVWVKDSEAIRIANNLYKRQIAVTLINFTGKVKTKTTIMPQDDIYQKIDEFCGVNSKPKSRLSKEFRKAEVIRHTITLNDFTNLGVNPAQLFRNKESFNKALEVFTKNAELYGLDSSNPVDMLTFSWMVSHSHTDFLETDRFKCPVCGNIVHVNGHEEYIKGKPVNTHETICEYCGEEFDIHDKQDVIELYYNKVFNK